MRRALVAVVAALGILLGTVAAVPAQAGEGYFTRTKCWADHPYDGMWYGQTSMGVWFRSVWGQYGVLGRFYPVHKALGAECGFGFPLNDPVRGDGAWVQFFYLPGTCDLRMIVAWDNGSDQPVVLPHIFC